mmetsp:Transcript_27890/g.41500  ORF Transcript_27890/g.41500 Transcript_27890/m.41500 type:complete len:221 (+) Transcript_27890:114-776(+)
MAVRQEHGFSMNPPPPPPPVHPRILSREQQQRGSVKNHDRGCYHCPDRTHLISNCPHLKGLQPAAAPAAGHASIGHLIGQLQTRARPPTAYMLLLSSTTSSCRQNSPIWHLESFLQLEGLHSSCRPTTATAWWLGPRLPTRRAMTSMMTITMNHWYRTSLVVQQIESRATSSRQLTGSACCLQQPEDGVLAHCLKCFSIVEGRCLIDLQVLPTAHVPRTP